jgi:hypothetical protein
MKKLVFLLCLAVFLFLSACNGPVGSTTDGKITVVVNNAESEEVFREEIGFKVGDNLVDLLKNHEEIAMKGNNHPSFGFYIVEMCGISATGNAWWNIKINGADAEVGVSSIELNDQDVITFTLME